MNRRGELLGDLTREWPEGLAVILMGVSFFLALITKPAINYALIFISGLAFGRVLFRQKKWIPFTTVFMMILVVIGFFLGGLLRTDGRALVLLFLTATVLVYIAHDKKWISSKEW